MNNNNNYKDQHDHCLKLLASTVASSPPNSLGTETSCMVTQLVHESVTSPDGINSEFKEMSFRKSQHVVKNGGMVLTTPEVARGCSQESLHLESLPGLSPQEEAKMGICPQSTPTITVTDVKPIGDVTDLSIITPPPPNDELKRPMLHRLQRIASLMSPGYQSPIASPGTFFQGIRKAFEKSPGAVNRLHHLRNKLYRKPGITLRSNHTKVKHAVAPREVKHIPKVVHSVTKNSNLCQIKKEDGPYFSLFLAVCILTAAFFVSWYLI